jgi:hypothetical protein
MAKIERFEDLIAWQKVRELTRAIYEVTRHGAFAKNYGLRASVQKRKGDGDKTRCSPPYPYSVESEKVKRLCPGSYMSFYVLTTACIAGPLPIWTTGLKYSAQGQDPGTLDQDCLCSSCGFHKNPTSLRSSKNNTG